MVWEEVPVYWTIHWDNPDTYQNAENQLSAMINRDKNSAATIIWSLANETPVSEARNEFLYRLSQKARELDKTRLLSAAMEVHTEDNPNEYIVEDKLADYVDIVSFNEYIGWYVGTPERLLNSTWKIPYNKPVFISEFGAGAKAGYHADSLTRFSEEYQADLYSKTIHAIQKINNLRGMSPWILVDFKSPRRQLAVIQDGWNRKGLIGNEGEKKQAFYILQKYYQNRSIDY
jgi:beta-glucuronidase